MRGALTVTSRLETGLVAGSPYPRVGQVGQPFVLLAEMSWKERISAFLFQADAGGPLLVVEGEGEGAVG